MRVAGIDSLPPNSTLSTRKPIASSTVHVRVLGAGGLIMGNWEMLIN